LVLLDRVAALTLADNDAFQEVRSVYEGSAGLRVPRFIESYFSLGVQTVDITREDNV
jgi:hypothetical protein